MRRLIAIATCAIVFCSFSAEILGAQATVAGVQIFVTDTLGQSMDAADIELINSREEVTNLTANLSTVPYNTYRLRVSAPGFSTSEQELRVYQPKVQARVALAIGSFGDREYRKLTGSIRPIPPTSQTWVKLVSFYGHQVMDARVDPAGKFSFTEPVPGNHILIVQSGSQFLHTRIVRITDKRDITIDLSKYGRTALD